MSLLVGWGPKRDFFYSLVRLLMTNDQILAQLRSLARAHGEGFKSQNECIDWANKVAPLLRFNNDHYITFLNHAGLINTVGLSANAHGTALNNMISTVQQAIAELESGINIVDSNTKDESPGDLSFPEKITLSWLFKHVPVSYWLWLGGAFVAVFIAGVGFSQTKAYTAILDLATTITTAGTTVSTTKK